ncbi:MAG: HAMP domain-containing histidine kinase [Gemmatimonadales bacterium]|nr:HAMP domain-containing histidine kinase [Gemmatimonadales bacterium]
MQLLIAANRAAAYTAAARWVVHDLRSPAQSLTLLADLMADPDTDIEEILRESCRHLGRSLDLLSRVLHPAPPGERGPISVREPLELIRDLHHAGRTRARLEVTVDASVPAAAGIERHLEHALLNLVLNANTALQHSDGGLIRIGARDNGEQVEIVVADNGPGLAPDLAGSLFQRALTGASGTRLSGAGLPVASEVLRISGGTLTYAPDTGPGARFVITLPRWRRAVTPRDQ